MNWGQVAISGAFGAWGGVGTAARLGVTSVVGQRVVGGMISSGAASFSVSNYQFATGDGPHTVSAYARKVGVDTAVGVGTGGLAGGAQHGLDHLGNRYLRFAQPQPFDEAAHARQLLGNPGDTVVLGRQADTAVARGWDGHAVLSSDRWTMNLNDEFIQGAIDYQRPVYLASQVEGNLIQEAGDYAGQPTIFARELDMLDQAGYTQQGDYMLPPGSR